MQAAAGAPPGLYLLSCTLYCPSTMSLYNTDPIIMTSYDMVIYLKGLA